MGHPRHADRRRLLLRPRHLHHPHHRDAPTWLTVLVLLFIWNGLKFAWIGPVSLITLIRVRHYEKQLIRRARDDYDAMTTLAAGQQ